MSGKYSKGPEEEVKVDENKFRKRRDRKSARVLVAGIEFPSSLMDEREVIGENVVKRGVLPANLAKPNGY